MPTTDSARPSGSFPLQARGLRSLAGETPGDDGPTHETASMIRFRETGSSECFEELYHLTRADVLGHIVRLCAQRGLRLDPRELLQDTYVNVYRYSRSFCETNGAGFRGWARAIAANVVRRAAARSRTVSLSAWPDERTEPCDLRAGPELCVSTGEQSDSLARAWILLLLHYAHGVEQLSGRDRAALELIEVDGLSYEEAGRVLRVGRSNMKMIMFRSRRRLRAHMLRAMDASQMLRARAG